MASHQHSTQHSTSQHLCFSVSPNNYMEDAHGLGSVILIISTQARSLKSRHAVKTGKCILRFTSVSSSFQIHNLIRRGQMCRCPSLFFLSLLSLSMCLPLLCCRVVWAASPALPGKVTPWCLGTWTAILISGTSKHVCPGNS